MRHAHRGSLPALATVVALLIGAAPATALKGAPGGAQAPSAAQAGGSQYGVSTRALPRPVVSQLLAPRTSNVGRPPRVSFRIDEAGVGTISVTITVSDIFTHRPVVSAVLGWVHTGRTQAVRWPSGATLGPGSFQLSVTAHDHHGGTVLRRAHSSGRASLTVTAPAPAPAPIAPTPAPEAGIASPAQTLADGAVFPVAGGHSFGGPDNRFGAARSGHIHQGQDVMTEEGTPVVLPLAGTIVSTSYQAGGAGYYAVEHTSVGLDLMFAHCQAGSFAVAEGQAVAAGQALCSAGQTGDATAPHLHFEMWVGGWQASGGHPIDPLPYLEAWQR